MPGWKMSGDETEQTRQHYAYALAKADLYWISPDMSDMVATLAPSIPDCMPYPPCPCGFALFARSIPGIDAVDGNQIYTTGFLWAQINLANLGDCLAVTTYSWRGLVKAFDQLKKENRRREAELDRKLSEVMPTQLFPTGGWEWPEGHMMEDFSSLPPSSAIMEASILEDRRILSTFWTLCSQKITVETRAQPSRNEIRAATRKRLPVPVDEVRVINLREVETRHPGQNGRDIDWQYRWIVSSHWRNQYYPSRGEHMPKLIDAYQKGPPDRPLKVRDTVKALVR
jgi:hypothetical protein